MSKCATRIILAVSVIGLTACGRLGLVSMYPHPIEQWLSDNMSTLNYADILMKFGPPSSTIEPDEDTFIATWGGSSDTTVVAPIYNMLLAKNINRGWRLNLMFHNKTKKLMRYNLETW